MAGAALPDADKPAKLWFGWSPFPGAFDRFHMRIQHEASRRATSSCWRRARSPAALIALPQVRLAR